MLLFTVCSYIPGVDAATIQRAAAGLPSNIYNSLAQVAAVTPAGVTPSRVTPGFTPAGFTPRIHTPHTPQVGSTAGFSGGFSGGYSRVWKLYYT